MVISRAFAVVFSQLRVRIRCPLLQVSFTEVCVAMGCIYFTGVVFIVMSFIVKCLMCRGSVALM